MATLFCRVKYNSSKQILKKRRKRLETLSYLDSEHKYYISISFLYMTETTVIFPTPAPQTFFIVMFLLMGNFFDHVSKTFDSIYIVFFLSYTFNQ